MRKGMIRKAQILAVAERQFFARGYLSTTLADILDEVGCTKGSFYHHFDTKYALLDAIAGIRAARAFEAYRESGQGDGLKLLNAMLYHAIPFNRTQQDFLAVVLTLGNTPEGTLILKRLLAVLRHRFLPELDRVLSQMRAEGTASSGNLPTSELVWDASMAFCTNILLEMTLGAAPSPERLMPQLHALRFLWERVLDIPYGSMRIVSLEEMTGVMNYAMRKAALSGQQKSDTAAQ